MQAYVRPTKGVIEAGDKSLSNSRAPDGTQRVNALLVKDAVDVGPAVAVSDRPGGRNSHAGNLVHRQAQLQVTAAVTGIGPGEAIANRRAGQTETGHGGIGRGKGKCCGLGETVKRWATRLPSDKKKILVVVRQISNVFSGIAGVQFPASYAASMSWLKIVNLDIGQLVSALCVLPPVNFLMRLLVATLTALLYAVGLVLTYRMAKCRAGTSSAGVIARRDAWSMHAAGWLLPMFLFRFGGFGVM